MLIGIDIVDIARIRDIVIRTPRFLQRIYTEQELDYCRRKADPYPSLAARFAVREAVRKLDAVFTSGLHFKDTEVVIGEMGKPDLVLHGAALELARQAGVKDFALSLSHSREQAIAVVIANKE